jgi:uncharacterized protein (DUF736 family)
MKELKRLDQYRFINKWGTIYIKVMEGWVLFNSIDGDDFIQVTIDKPTFEESILELLEVEFNT